MALRGTLGDFSLSDILQLIGLQRKSGVLVLERKSDQVVLGFSNGRIVSAESTARPAEQRVGQLLVRIGKLTEPRLEEALRIQRETLQRLGHVLVSQGWVEPETIRRQLALQITETIYELFRWRSGEYDFRPEESVEWDQEFVEPIPSEHLLMEGARIVDEWPMIERTIPSQDIVLRPTAEGAALLTTASNPHEAQGSIYDDDIDFELIPSDPLDEGAAGPRLSNRERLVLRWVDSARTVGEIAELTELGRFEACKILARFIERRLVEPDHDARGTETAWRAPRLMRSETPARAALVALGVLAALGAAAAVNQLVGVVAPGARIAGLPPTATPAASIEAMTGLDDAARVAALAREQRLERAVKVFFLYSGTWPGDARRLEEHGLVSRGGLGARPGPRASSRRPAVDGAASLAQSR